MDFAFKVHSANSAMLHAKGNVGGSEVDVVVEGFRVELVGADRGVGSLTLEFIGKSVDAAKETFIPDSQVTLTA